MENKRPGRIGAVTADTSSLDRPNTSVTKHSHFRQWPISSKRTLYEREHWVANGSKDWLSPDPLETNLHPEIHSKCYIHIKQSKGGREICFLPLIFHLVLIDIPYMLLDLTAWNLFDNSLCFSLNLISLENKCLDFEWFWKEIDKEHMWLHKTAKMWDGPGPKLCWGIEL